MDYTTLRTSQLQHLASGGDVAATKEISRRATQAPSVVTVDVTRLDDRGLRQLVARWRDGRMPEDRARNRDVAERAFAELAARFNVDVRRWERGQGREPLALMVPPWLAPRQPRVADWERPRGSTCYPAEPVDTRDRFEALTGQRQ